MAKQKDRDQERTPQETPAEEALEVETPETDICTEEDFPEEKSEIERMGEKLEELNDKYMRLMAEYDNFRKRSQRERDEIYPSATAKVLEKFLPVLDNLERAAAFPHSDDDFGKGFDMIYQSFKDVLAALGVEEIGAVGDPFDPNLHNAVMHVEDKSFGENVVSQVLQKGYRMGEKVIRYAMIQTAN